MKKFILLTLAPASIAFAAPAAASPATTTSPTGGALPTNVTAVGGVVVDLTGANGNRVVSQVAASTEYVGYPSANPLLFATQNGFDSSVIAALGGGITAASFRITLYDGDNQAGDFDFNENSLLVNGLDFGNFSSVATQETDGTGVTVFSSGMGFGDNILSTGFFSSSDLTLLTSFFATLSSGKIEFGLDDVDVGDQFYDFQQGLDSSVINIGSGPVVTPPSSALPEPGTWAFMILGFGLIGATLRRTRRVAGTKMNGAARSLFA